MQDISVRRNGALWGRRSVARAAEIETTAADLGARHVARTQSAAQREAQAEDDATAGRYARLGQSGLSDELNAIQIQNEQLRKELGI